MGTPGPAIAVTLDPGMYLSSLSQSVDAHLGALRASLRSLEDGSFKTKAATPRPGAFLRFSFDLTAPPAIAASQLCNRCFVSIVGELVTFLDRMIAFKRLASQQLTTPNDVATADDVLQFVQRRLDDEYTAVARDTNLTNPKKVAFFPGIADIARDASLSYFAVRRCLEHHGGRPAEELTLRYGRLKLLSGDMEFTQAGQSGLPGVGISLGMDHSTRVIPPGAAVALTEEELEHIVFTIKCLIGPEVRRVLQEATAPPATPEATQPQDARAGE